MKKLIAAALALFLCAALITGCTKQEDNAGISAGEGKLQVVTTIFPQYDFVREIAGDLVELHLLVPPGSESHSFEPTPQDMITIQNCDMFIYVGGDSDAWVDKVLGSFDNSSMKILKLMDMTEVVEEEIVEGMEDGHDHGHSHGSSDFTDDEVQDRALTDWAGDWQSVYPLLTSGALDAVMEHKAEHDDDMSVQDYYAYYEAGYQTDVERMVITENTMAFYTNGLAAEAEYVYAGFEILTYESGSRGVRYMFEAVGDTGGAPRYVQFSDHGIAPEIAEHFHIYAGDVSQEALWEQLDNWPTYYLSDLDAEGIVEEMIGHEDGHDHDDDEHETEYDEHVWTSPKNAKLIAQGIAQALIEIDGENETVYSRNIEAYASQLDELDAAFREVVADAKRTTLIFGDRFPFRYFVDEYGLSYYAAFPGCSTETEASAATVAFLIDKVKEEEIPVVFHIEFSNGRMADAICESTGAEKRMLHSCHNVSKDDIAAGTSYLELMQQNVEILKEALS